MVDPDPAKAEWVWEDEVLGGELVLRTAEADPRVRIFQTTRPSTVKLTLRVESPSAATSTAELAGPRPLVGGIRC